MRYDNGSIRSPCSRPENTATVSGQHQAGAAGGGYLKNLPAILTGFLEDEVVTLRRPERITGPLLSGISLGDNRSR
ncbi:MAG TPA: hypothetical protein DIT99_03190, partial [Candidatus Latescibacteria bacterium]|nr:hypothetical protein [Candidatus Latescibacterota bacterium]